MNSTKKMKHPYGYVANSIINDKCLSFCAKGVYLYILSKPDNWDFSFERIAHDSSDSKDKVRRALKELEENKLLARTKLKTGRVVYEIKDPVAEASVFKSQNQNMQLGTEKPCLECASWQCASWLCATISNKDNKVIKSISNKEIYIGEFNNVKLSEGELEKLKDTIPNYLMLIENLSSYMKSKNKRYASHYATILNWNRKNQEEKNKYIKSIKLV